MSLITQLTLIVYMTLVFVMAEFENYRAGCHGVSCKLELEATLLVCYSLLMSGSLLIRWLDDALHNGIYPIATFCFYKVSLYSLTLYNRV